MSGELFGCHKLGGRDLVASNERPWMLLKFYNAQDRSLSRKNYLATNGNSATVENSELHVSHIYILPHFHRLTDVILCIKVYKCVYELNDTMLRMALFQGQKTRINEMPIDRRTEVNENEI